MNRHDSVDGRPASVAGLNLSCFCPLIIHMETELVLASASPTRHAMLVKAGVPVTVKPAQVDESAVRDALVADATRPRDIADALAEMKALRVSRKMPGRLVLGCDQVLDLDGTTLSKPASAEAARATLLSLRGRSHELFSAAVICEDGAPIWRHVGRVRLMVRDFSEAWLDGYISRNWPEIGGSAGGYMIEAEGVRLFTRIDGDHFSILGLPLLELLSFLTVRGDLEQ